MGEYQLRAIRELSKCFYAETKIPNRDALQTPQYSLMKKRTKLLRVEDNTYPPPRVDPDEKSNNREHKLPNPIQTNPSSAATRENYTNKYKEPVKQRCRGHYTENKYDLPKSTHRYNTISKLTRVEPMAQHIVLLATNLQGNHQANVVIDPTTGASVEYRRLIRGPNIAI